MIERIIINTLIESSVAIMFYLAILVFIRHPKIGQKLHEEGHVKKAKGYGCRIESITYGKRPEARINQEDFDKLDMAHKRRIASAGILAEWKWIIAIFLPIGFVLYYKLPSSMSWAFRYYIWFFSIPIIGFYLAHLSEGSFFGIIKHEYKGDLYRIIRGDYTDVGSGVDKDESQ